jgi:hypothetical protein
LEVKKKVVENKVSKEQEDEENVQSDNSSLPDLDAQSFLEEPIKKNKKGFCVLTL